MQLKARKMLKKTTKIFASKSKSKVIENYEVTNEKGFLIVLSKCIVCVKIMIINIKE